MEGRVLALTDLEARVMGERLAGDREHFHCNVFLLICMFVGQGATIILKVSGDSMNYQTILLPTFLGLVIFNLQSAKAWFDVYFEFTKARPAAGISDILNAIDRDAHVRVPALYSSATIPLRLLSLWSMLGRTGAVFLIALMADQRIRSSYTAVFMVCVVTPFVIHTAILLRHQLCDCAWVEQLDELWLRSSPLHHVLNVGWSRIDRTEWMFATLLVGQMLCVCFRLDGLWTVHNTPWPVVLIPTWFMLIMFYVGNVAACVQGSQSYASGGLIGALVMIPTIFLGLFAAESGIPFDGGSFITEIFTNWNATGAQYFLLLALAWVSSFPVLLVVAISNPNNPCVRQINNRHLEHLELHRLADQPLPPPQAPPLPI
jgi:hypothetical protein